MANAPKYSNLGNVGAMGDDARSDNNMFVQTTPASTIDLGELVAELGRVRTEMKRKADSADADHDAEIGAIARAEKAAKDGDKSRALEFLKGAGKWTLDVAKSVAAGIVKDAIEGKIGA
jgi:hypothetical protein